MDRLTKYTAELRKRLIDLRDELKTAYDSISQLDGANSSLMAANEKLAADRKALINELCQYCGKYKQAHEGACDGCKWRGMRQRSQRVQNEAAYTQFPRKLVGTHDGA